MPTGTGGDDLFFFEGDLTQVTATLVNPYSGASVFVDEQKNMNTGSYNGLGGIDVLLMTNFGDAIFLFDSMGNQVVSSVEVFIAGDGGDVVFLADAIALYGNANVFGGANGDIIWTNAGNDELRGSTGDDILDAGPGNDLVYGEEDNDDVSGGDGNDTVNGGAGNDVVRGDRGNDLVLGEAGNDELKGGAGNDRLEGGDGDDTIYGGDNTAAEVYDKIFADEVVFPHLVEGTKLENLSPPGTPSLGVVDGNLDIEADTSATITFRDGFAGYNNSLGIYRIGINGEIEAAQILWANVKTAGVDVAHTIDLPTTANGASLGFFIIADGDNVNNHYSGLNITGDGVVRFVYDYGLGTERAATVNDAGSHVTLIYDDGVTSRVLNGYDYHTTDRSTTPGINWDNETHVVSGLANPGDNSVLRIGFEDLPNLGDADYEDVLFDLNINPATVDHSDNGNDVLIGGAGNDSLFGEAGNDILVVGRGLDHIYGGSGNDQIIYNYMDAVVDIIHGFTTGAGKDVLNLTDILQGYDPMSDALSDFVQLFNNVSGQTEVRVNADGDVGGAFTTIAAFDTTVTQTLSQLVAAGNIVADHHVVV